MTVLIFGQRELEAEIRAGKPLASHLISIGNPRWPWKRPEEDEAVPPAFRRRFERILRLSFYDRTSTDQIAPGHRRRIPRDSDVLKVKRFFEETRHQASGYVIHCWAGVSRSAGVAFGLLYLISGDEDEAARRLMTIRHQASPHPLLVEAWDRLLGTGLRFRSAELRDARMAALRRELADRVHRLNRPGDDDLEELEPAP